MYLERLIAWKFDENWITEAKVIFVNFSSNNKFLDALKKN